MRAVSSLTNRIFLACTAVAALSLGLAFTFVNARVAQQAEDELRSGLGEAGQAVDRHLDTVSDTFARLARLIADLPKLKAAVETGDPPTIQPLADDYAVQMRADVFVLTAPDGRLLARVGEPVDGLPPLLTAGGLEERTAVLPHDRGLLEVISVPLVLDGDLPAVLGRLTAGFFLDDALAQQIKGLTASDIAFRAGPRIVAATLAPDLRPVAERVAAGTQPVAVRLGPEEFLVVERPLATPPTAGDGGRPVALIFRSRSARLGMLSTVRTGLVIAFAITVVIATIVSFGVARTMTRPLQVVTTTMKEMAATGDLTRRVSLASGPWADEDARVLATTFNGMTDAISRFQREAAHRERLSSLGRLSTVIAHEIRNPLMIIRAALPTLKRATPDDEDLRDAVNDIDEETTRLNRVVSDVLDFARPLRFDLAATDVNAVCRASATAAWAGADGAVRLDLDPALPEVVTDAERLRVALVNLLVNARHAVDAATADDAAADQTRPAVTLATRVAGNRVTIAIRDLGVGIAPEHMPHIFDPYFTTRRAGTGLGLPITKNIIEGLGGDIAATSVRGTGTEMRITLPLAAGAGA